MEMKNIDIILENKNGKQILSTELNEEKFLIDLESDGEEELKKLYLAIIEELFKNKLKFKLNYDSTYKEFRYIEVSEAYVDCLNEEIDNIFNEIEKIK